MPKTGGGYVYINRCFGPIAGFMFGWAQLFIVRTSAAAGLALIVGLISLRAVFEWQRSIVDLVFIVTGIPFAFYWCRRKKDSPDPPQINSSGGKST